MPAVSIARLQNHLELLYSSFNSPQIFVSELKDLLELYSDRTFHPGEESHLDRRIPRYYIPILLEKQLDMEFRQLAISRPEDAFTNAHLLWKDVHFESRVIAAGMLGSIPVSFARGILETIRQWLNEPMPQELLAQVLGRSTCSLRLARSQEWTDQIKTWLDAGSTRLQGRGILALSLTAQDDSFANLPLAINLVDALFKSPPSLLIPDLVALYEMLVSRFKQEMLVYTRELITRPTDANRVKLLRKVIPLFGDPISMDLRAKLPPTRLK